MFTFTSFLTPFLRMNIQPKTVVEFQWPGYDLWERQIHIRDLTRFRNEITLRRFARLVAGVVDRFLTVRLLFCLFGTSVELLCSMQLKPLPMILTGGLERKGSLVTTLLSSARCKSPQRGGCPSCKLPILIPNVDRNASSWPCFIPPT